MEIIEIKARMFDLIQDLNKIEFEKNNKINSLQKEADQVIKETEILLAPINKELTELNNQLINNNEQSES